MADVPQSDAVGVDERKRASTTGVAPLNIGRNHLAFTANTSSSASTSAPVSQPVSSRASNSRASPQIIAVRPDSVAFNLVDGIGLHFDSPEPLALDLTSSATHHTETSMSTSTRNSSVSWISGSGTCTLCASDASTLSTTCSAHSAAHTSPPWSISSSRQRGSLVCAKSHDAAFQRPVQLPEQRRRASLLTAVPMGLSKSHQQIIDACPAVFQRHEAERLFQSIRGLMHEFSRIGLGEGQDEHVREPQQNVTPSISIDTVAACAQVDSTAEAVPQSHSWSQQHDQQNLVPPSAHLSHTTTDVQHSTPPPTKSLWHLFRSRSPASTCARATSASSYSSTSSFMARSTSPAANNPRTSNTSNSSFSLFSRKLLVGSASDVGCTSTTTDRLARARLTRTRVDECALAELMVSCADARHTLKTSSSPEMLREAGLKLERGWRDQLAEAHELRTKLELVENTVEDLDEENHGLRGQLGCLSEQLAQREEENRAQSAKLEEELQSVRSEVQEASEIERSAWQVERSALIAQWMEERAITAGLGVMLGKTREIRSQVIAGEGDSMDVQASLVLDQASDDAIGANLAMHVQEALVHARALQTEELLEWHSAYEQILRCSEHRFAQAEAAPPSTLVDERVLLIGSDERLLCSIVQRLGALGLTRVLVATPVSRPLSPCSSAVLRESGIQTITFDLMVDKIWAKFVHVARARLRGDLDCVVNAFDRLTVDELGALGGLVRDQCVSTSTKPLSVVNVVYDVQGHAGAMQSMCTMAMIGLCRSLSIHRHESKAASAVRLNTVVSECGGKHVVESIVRLIDPCCYTAGAVVHVGGGCVSCLGAPLCSCTAQASGALVHAMQARDERTGWLSQNKRIADCDLWEAIQSENSALKARCELLERQHILANARRV